MRQIAAKENKRQRMALIRKLQASFINAVLCLVTCSLVISLTAVAQGDGPDGNSANRAHARKEFSFEVLSIRPHSPRSKLLDTQYLPDGYHASFNLNDAIMQAYVPQWYLRFSSKIVDAPDWVSHDWYDIEARVAPEDVAAWQQAQDGVDSELLRSALQAAFRERFKLALHMTPIEVPCLNLMVSKRGAKLKDTVPGAIKPIGGKTYTLGKGFYIQDNGKRQFVGVSMDDFARYLTRLNKGHVVQDRTDLTGRHDFTLPWYDDEHNPSTEVSNPLDLMPITSIGLMLKSGKGPGIIIDIDHIEKLAPN
jgi:uncharacterized protein (TIGR03435 family)